VPPAAAEEILEHLGLVIVSTPGGRAGRVEPGPDLEHTPLGVVKLVPDAANAGEDLMGVALVAHDLPFAMRFDRASNID
jgi:hypothetical protein